MGERFRAREAALQALYQIDMAGRDAKEDSEELPGEKGLSADARAFASELVRGVRSGVEDIDRRIGECSDNWSVGRMAVIDRNILRLAVFELTTDTPTKVVLNEAIELAKKFGEESSSAFINGILDKVVREDRE